MKVSFQKTTIWNVTSQQIEDSFVYNISIFATILGCITDKYMINNNNCASK